MLESGEVGRVTRFVEDDDDHQSATPSASLPNEAGSDRQAPDDGPAALVDDGALAMLVGEMDFNVERAREALRMFDNDVERAVDYLLRQES